MNIAIVWGSSTGYTEEAAKAIKAELGQLVEDVREVSDMPAADFGVYDVIIVGCPTWNVGELQEDWEDKLPELEGVDFSGKKVAFFGCGDAIGYPDTFQDAMGIIWKKLEARGGTLVGQWPITGYDFEDSKALNDDRTHFIGLALDPENEADKTDERIKGWVASLKSELGG